MKRALLIAGGTVGGLGAVLSITPPHFGSTSKIAGGIAKATPTPTPQQTHTAAAATSSPKSKLPNGIFKGSVSQTQFGNVQVEITVVNGKITSARALQSPNRDYRSQQISQQAVPYLIQETLAAQSANIQGVGGASYTSQGWYDSLVSALAKAGM